MKPLLKDRLQKISALALAGKWRRLLHAPKRYVSGQYFFRTTYQKTKKGKLVEANTFFDTSMNVLLPAGMDIYLLGAKTHDSEIRLTLWMLNNLTNGNTVLDIGTHFGFYSLLAAKLVGNNGKVIGIEASKAVHEVCQKNTTSVKNIQLFHLAATDQDAELSFYEFPVLYSEYNTIDPEQFEDSDWVKENPPQQIIVKGTRADTLLQSCNAIPDFIKIDVEGAEAKVISGLKNTLVKHKPIVALEYLSDERTNSAHALAARQLFDFGYQAYFITESGGLKRTNDIGEDMRIGNIESDNVIFQCT
ncbi:MAG: FkbM family methyltransferase [Saprospiraceae bacterium]